MVGNDQVVISKQAEFQLQLRGSSTLSMTSSSPSGFYSYPNSEEYAEISENTFKWASKTPLSTFSIDVDGASYSNVRRMIMDGHLPVKDAVRIEELINYFNYDYEHPVGEHPFSVNTEVGKAPWNRIISWFKSVFREKKLKQIIFRQVTWFFYWMFPAP